MSLYAETSSRSRSVPCPCKIIPPVSSLSPPSWMFPVNLHLKASTRILIRNLNHGLGLGLEGGCLFQAHSPTSRPGTFRSFTVWSEQNHVICKEEIHSYRTLTPIQHQATQEEIISCSSSSASQSRPWFLFWDNFHFDLCSAHSPLYSVFLWSVFISLVLRASLPLVSLRNKTASFD